MGRSWHGSLVTRAVAPPGAAEEERGVLGGAGAWSDGREQGRAVCRAREVPVCQQQSVLPSPCASSVPCRPWAGTRGGEVKAPVLFTSVGGQEVSWDGTGRCAALPGARRDFTSGGVAASHGGVPGAHPARVPPGKWRASVFLLWAVLGERCGSSTALACLPCPCRRKQSMPFILPCRNVVNCSVTPGWSSGRTFCGRERCSPAASLGLVLVPCSIVPSQALQQHLRPERFCLCLCPCHVLSAF